MKPVWEELGLQTIHDSTAAFIRRGYGLPVFEDALRRLKAAGLTVIVHVILGLPGETRLMMAETVHYLAQSPIDGIKLQLLHVLKGTELCRLYEREPFHVMEPEEYFSLIEQMVRRFALPKEGEICFSQRDLKRLPDQFEKRLEQAAAERGGSLKIGREPASLDGGFLFDYDGIEENCSFQALLAAKRDECSDQIQKLLFEKE